MTDKNNPVACPARPVVFEPWSHDTSHLRFCGAIALDCEACRRLKDWDPLQAHITHTRHIDVTDHALRPF